MTLSLRTQLTIWLIIAAVTIAFGVTFLTEQVTTWNMERSLDDSLRTRANMVAALISSDITTDEASYAAVIGDLARQELPFVPSLLRVVSPSGRVIIEFGKMTASVSENLDSLAALSDSGTGHFDSIRLAGVEPLRAYSVAVFDPRTRQILAVVQIAESLDPIENTRHQLLATGAAVASVGSLLGVVAGLVLIRRGFRPLSTILRAINDIDYTHLGASLKQEPRVAEMEHLAKSLTSMSQRLDTAVGEKQMFIGGISHDLRTPLTVLQGQLEVLLLQPSLAPETRQSLERMLSETRRLIRLVKNLLLSVQLESKPTILNEPVNMTELLDEVVADMLTMAGDVRFKFSIASDLIVYGDRDLFKQMLINIIHNAIKFAPEVGGRIEVSLTSRDEWVVLEVSDNGAGIPAADLPHVTEAFYKPSASQKSAHEGTRLGLSIVKQISELHGGQLEIRSEEQVGTSVRVRLPKRVLIVLPETKGAVS